MCFIYFHDFGFVLFFFKQKTAYEMRISDWSSDVCSSDLTEQVLAQVGSTGGGGFGGGGASDLREGTMTVILHHDRDLTTDAFQQKLTPLLNDVPDVRFFNQRDRKSVV